MQNAANWPPIEAERSNDDDSTSAVRTGSAEDTASAKKKIEKINRKGKERIPSKIENMEDNVVTTGKAVSPKRPSSSRGPPS